MTCILINQDGYLIRLIKYSSLFSLLMVKGGHWSLSPSSMDVSNDLYMLLISWWVISQLAPDTFNSGLDLRFNLAIR